MSNRAQLIAGLAAAALALAACGPKPGAQASSSNATASGGATGQPSVQQLEATAVAEEARAKQLEAQAAAPATATPSPAGSQTLGAGDETLHSGQYYKAVPIPMSPGDVYQVNYVAHGYSPVIVVLDQDKQPFSQSTAGPNLQPGEPLTTEIRPDKSGVWYVLLSANTPGAGGTFEVNVQKIAQTPLN
jgi:hypothetical protein